MSEFIKSSPARAGRGGFTLVEVLLVVVIIGILAAVAVPKIAGRGKDAKISACKSTLQAITLALKLYEVDHSNYPASLNDLISGSGPEWRGPYLETGLPKDPWGADYIYSVNQNGFTLKSAGPPGGSEISLQTTGGGK